MIAQSAGRELTITRITPIRPPGSLKITMEERMKNRVIAVCTAAMLAVGGLVAVQPAFASEAQPLACSVVAYTPSKSGGSVKYTGGRTGCPTAVSTTVYGKGVRNNLPDSVLCKSSKSAANSTWSCFFGTPTSGSKYRTQAESTTGQFTESGVLTW